MAGVTPAGPPPLRRAAGRSRCLACPAGGQGHRLPARLVTCHSAHGLRSPRRRRSPGLCDCPQDGGVSLGFCTRPKAQGPVLSHHSQGLPGPGPAGGRAFQGAVAPQAPRHGLDCLPRRDPMCPLLSPHLHDVASSLGPGFGPAVNWTCLEGRSGGGGECPGGSNDQGHRFSLGGALDLESKVALVVLRPCPSRAVDGSHSNSALLSEPAQVPEPLLRCPSTQGMATSEPSGQTWPSVPRFPRGPPRGLGVCAPPGQ